MKKITLALLSSLLLAGVSTYAQASLRSDMSTLSSNLSVAQQTDSLVAFKEALSEMRTAATDAKNYTLPSLNGKNANGPDMVNYLHGYDVLIGQIDDATKLANAGQLTEAQSSLAAINDTRKQWHKAYK